MKTLVRRASLAFAITAGLAVLCAVLAAVVGLNVFNVVGPLLVGVAILLLPTIAIGLLVLGARAVRRRHRIARDYARNGEN